MKTALSVLAGIVWGALAALVNLSINKKALAKNSTNALLAANLGRTVVDLLALAAVFLLRKILPLPYEAMMLGTAISLSVLTVVFAYRMAGRQGKGKG